MKKILKKIRFILNIWGFYPNKTLYTIRGIYPVLKDYFKFKHQLKSNNIPTIINFVPLTEERFAQSGTAKGHYFHQDLLIAQKVFSNNPNKHVDVGSRVDGFVAHVATFREIEVLDIRMLENTVTNIKFMQADLTHDSFNLINYCDSISSLHAIEHFGLGRYGDPIDINGYLKGLNNIHKMLTNGGKFYFSIPIGSQRIEFNAQRVFSVKYLVDLLKERYLIDSFSYVNDNGDLILNAKLSDDKIENNYSCNFGCGIFELTKK